MTCISKPHTHTHTSLRQHRGADLAGVLNRADWPADRPVLARLVHLAGDASLPGAYNRDGVTYVEGISATVLPPVETLKQYDALVLLSGFGAVMASGFATLREFGLLSSVTMGICALTDLLLLPAILVRFRI